MLKKASHTNLCKRASYSRINHLDIFPHFCSDLSQRLSFCICDLGSLVSQIPSSIQSELNRWFQVLRSPRRQQLFVPALNLSSHLSVLFVKSLADLYCTRTPQTFVQQARPLFRATAYGILQSSALQTIRIIGGRQSLPSFRVRYSKWLPFQPVLRPYITCWLSRVIRGLGTLLAIGLVVSLICSSTSKR